MPVCVVIVLLLASFAVTVTENGAPATCVPDAGVTVKWSRGTGRDGDSGATGLAGLHAVVDVDRLVASSLERDSVRERVNAVVVAAADRERVVGGEDCLPIRLVNWTVPLYPMSVLLLAFFAVTVTLKLSPAVEVPGATTSKWSRTLSTVTEPLAELSDVHDRQTAVTL